MAVGALRALVFAVNQAVHGVPATVTRPAPDQTPVTTTGIWAVSLTDEQRIGSDVQAANPRKVFVIPRDVTFDTRPPRGTLIEAPDETGSVAKLWRVDGLERSESDQWRLIVLPS